MVPERPPDHVGLGTQIKSSLPQPQVISSQLSSIASGSVSICCRARGARGARSEMWDVEVG